MEKTERYRLLNDPTQAESICRDVLRLAPDHEGALVTIILALTDQFSSERGAAGARTARDYYGGVICERQARALLTRGMARVFRLRRPAGRDGSLRAGRAHPS